MQRNTDPPESSSGGNRTLIFAVLGMVVLAVLVIGIIWFVSRNRQTTEEAQPAQPGTPAQDSGHAEAQARQRYLPGLPTSGDGGDPVLNTLKNRIDQAQWQSVPLSSVLALTWPQDIERQPRARWSRADIAEIARYEGAPLQVEGYLVDAKKMSPETCNCHSVDEVDFHIWMVDAPNQTRAGSIVIEVSPRVGSVHPNWTLTNIRNIARRHEKVRISGWLMMDPEHPDQVGKTRGTIWEIHPIMQIETQGVRGAWKPLDNGTTGVTSAPVNIPAATAPVLTPVATATMPPEGNVQVQDNNVVQITTVNADGVKGSAEPDEYVADEEHGPVAGGHHRLGAAGRGREELLQVGRVHYEAGRNNQGAIRTRYTPRAAALRSGRIELYGRTAATWPSCMM